MNQETALRIMRTGENIFLTGDAGTGKSYLVEQYIEECEKNGLRVQVYAPTGVAAANVNGMTTFTGFKIPIDVGRQEQLRESRNPQVHMALAHADVIVIDEISMATPASFDFAMRTLRSSVLMGKGIDIFSDTPVYSPSEPSHAHTDIGKMYFGEKPVKQTIMKDFIDADYYGVNNDSRKAAIEDIKSVIESNNNLSVQPNRKIGPQIIFVGDFYQLPPVIQETDKVKLSVEHQNMKMAFETESWKNLNIHPIVLTEPKRQKDVKFQEFLQRIRNGDATAVDDLSRFVIDPSSIPEDDDTMQLMGYNSSVAEGNARAIRKLRSSPELHVIPSISPMVETTNQYGQTVKRVPPVFSNVEMDIPIRLDERVMTTCNGRDLIYTNGSMGNIQDVQFTWDNRKFSLRDLMTDFRAVRNAFDSKDVNKIQSVISDMSRRNKEFLFGDEYLKRSELSTIQADDVYQLSLSEGIEFDFDKLEKDANGVYTDESVKALKSTMTNALNELYKEPFESDKVVLVLQMDNGNTIEIGEHLYDEVEYNRDGVPVVKNSAAQLPIKPAYAVSIHKSQGATYDKVRVTPQIFNEAQLYVALSRCTSPDGLSIVGLTDKNRQGILEHMKIDDSIVEFHADANAQDAIDSMKYGYFPDGDSIAPHSASDLSLRFSMNANGKRSLGFYAYKLIHDEDTDTYRVRFSEYKKESDFDDVQDKSTSHRWVYEMPITKVDFDNLNRLNLVDDKSENYDGLICSSRIIQPVYDANSTMGSRMILRPSLAVKYLEEGCSMAVKKFEKDGALKLSDCEAFYDKLNEYKKERGIEEALIPGSKEFFDANYTSANGGNSSTEEFDEEHFNEITSQLMGTIDESKFKYKVSIPEGCVHLRNGAVDIGVPGVRGDATNTFFLNFHLPYEADTDKIAVCHYPDEKCFWMYMTDDLKLDVYQYERGGPLVCKTGESVTSKELNDFYVAGKDAKLKSVNTSYDSDFVFNVDKKHITQCRDKNRNATYYIVNLPLNCDDVRFTDINTMSFYAQSEHITQENEDSVTLSYPCNWKCQVWTNGDRYKRVKRPMEEIYAAYQNGYDGPNGPAGPGGIGGPEDLPFGDSTPSNNIDDKVETVNANRITGENNRITGENNRITGNGERPVFETVDSVSDNEKDEKE